MFVFFFRGVVDFGEEKIYRNRLGKDLTSHNIDHISYETSQIGKSLVINMHSGKKPTSIFPIKSIFLSQPKMGNY